MTLPFVSCICITRHRRFFLRRAVEYFERAQKAYAYKGDGRCELIIVDGSLTLNSQWGARGGPSAASPRYIHLPESDHDGVHQTRIGHYTNVACEAARGDVILKWDDDDWHSPFRIDKQARVLASLDEALTFSSRFYWYDLREMKACKARGWDLGAGTAGSILGFHKSVWRKTPFEEKGVEDTPFCAENEKKGVVMHDLADASLYMYMRHAGNSSPMTLYRWTEEDTKACRDILYQVGDLSFYDELSEMLPHQPWNEPRFAPGSQMRVMNPLQAMWGRHFR